MAEEGNEEDHGACKASGQKEDDAHEGVDVDEVHDQEEGRREQYEDEGVVRSYLQSVRLQVLIVIQAPGGVGLRHSRRLRLLLSA